MAFIKPLQLCRSFTSYGVFQRNICAVQKVLFYDKYSKIIEGELTYNRVQHPLHFSTSITLKADSKAMCEGDKKDLVVSYKDILQAQNDTNVLIIDVREQSEINETGKLPGSIHIPMGNVANTLLTLSDKDFKDTFNMEKPSKDKKIILSCRSGKRSAKVQEEIQKLGYENAYNYAGGWLDWENNQKV